MRPPPRRRRRLEAPRAKYLWPVLRQVVGQMRRVDQALRGESPHRAPWHRIIREWLPEISLESLFSQACGANHGALEVVVGPQGSPLAYLAVCKPGLGLVTSQALGPVAGFSVDSAGNILGVDGGEGQYPPPPKCCCAFDSLGP